jgi:hypothetical protein
MENRVLTGKVRHAVTGGRGLGKTATGYGEGSYRSYHRAQAKLGQKASARPVFVLEIRRFYRQNKLSLNQNSRRPKRRSLTLVFIHRHCQEPSEAWQRSNLGGLIPGSKGHSREVLALPDAGTGIHHTVAAGHNVQNGTLPY